MPFIVVRAPVVGFESPTDALGSAQRSVESAAAEADESWYVCQVLQVVKPVMEPRSETHKPTEDDFSGYWHDSARQPSPTQAPRREVPPTHPKRGP